MAERLRVEVIGQVAPGSVLVLRDAPSWCSPQWLADVAGELRAAVGHDRFVVVFAGDGPLPEVLTPAEARALRDQLDRIVEGP